MATKDELRLLRSYLDGPRIWDATSLQNLVNGLLMQKLIEPVPGRGALNQITQLGRDALSSTDG